MEGKTMLKEMIKNTLIETVENPRCDTCYYFNEGNTECPCAMGNDTSEHLCYEWAISSDEAEDIAEVIMDFIRIKLGVK